MKQALISKCKKLETDPMLVRIGIEALFCWIRQSTLPVTAFSKRYPTGHFLSDCAPFPKWFWAQSEKKNSILKLPTKE
jgi:hypothetical protein